MILDAPHEAKWSIGTCAVRVKDISCGMKRLEKNRSKFGSRIAEAAARGGFQVAPCAPPNMPFGARIRPNTGETVVSLPSLILRRSGCRSEERRVGKECRFRWSA